MRARVIACVWLGWLAVMPRSAAAEEGAPCARLASASEHAACVAAHAPEAGRLRRRYAVALGAVGVAMTGLGLGFGLSAVSAWDRAVSACSGRPTDCPGAAVMQAARDRNSARSAARTADWFVGLGSAAILGGVIVYLTAPREPARPAAHALRVAPTLDAGAVGLAVTGTLP